MYLFNNAAFFEHLEQTHKIKQRSLANSKDCLTANSPDEGLRGMLDRIKDHTLIKLIELMSH